MATASPQEPPCTGPAEGLKLTCPRCETVAPVGTVECPVCGRHFLVCCRACGHLNPRAAVRCEACAHQLRVRRHSHQTPAIHRLVWPRRWDWRHRPRWVLPAQLLVTLLAVFLGVQAILFLHARYALAHAPNVADEAELYVMPDGKIVELPPGTTFGKRETD